MKTFALIFMAVILSVGKCICSERNLVIAARLAVKDITGRADISKFFQEKKSVATLNFPNTTRRLYKARDFNFSWFNTWDKQQNLWDAMMTLDCVKQYGLDRANYHSKEVSYSVLKSVLEDPQGNNWALK